MPDLHTRRDPAWIGVVSLVGGAACGPGAPVMTAGDTSDGTDSSAGSTSATDPTNPTDPTAPTSTTTTPPECVNNEDCAGECTYCADGVCSYAPGCCGYYEVSPGAPLQWRCSPPYECYGDGDCGDGYVCQYGECIPGLPPNVPLPACPPAAVELGEWNLGNAPSAFVLADFDGDMDLDLAAAQPGVAQIELALNDGAGNFVIAGAFGVGAPTESLALAAGDLDGDLDLDLATARAEAPGALVLLFGQDAKFVPGPALQTPDDPTQVFITDVDGDNATDVVTLNLGVPPIEVRLGDGAGTFTSPQSGGIDSLLDPRALVTDVTLDGLADIVAPITLGTSAGVWAGAPDGTFAPIFSVDANGPDLAAFTADLDINMLPDIIFARQDGTVRVWHGTELGVWSDAPSEFFSDTQLLGGVIGEFDGPEGPDLVSATGVAAVTMLLGDGQGGFACQRQLAVSADTTRPLLVAGDIDGDGHTDLITGDRQSTLVTVLHLK